MYDYTLAQWLLFFYAYCFFGWCIESTWVSAHQKRFVNRGFLRGTWIPIYGFGAMVMLLAAIPARDNWFWLFFSGMFFASVLEYVTGVCMEKIFKVRYWDYSDKPFNLNGHICLGTSIAWGLLTIVLTQLVHQPMERLLLSLPPLWSNILAGILSTCFAVDVVCSVKTALDFRSMLMHLHEKALEKAAVVRENAEERLGEIRENAGERFGEIRGNAEERLEEIRDALGSRMNSWQHSLLRNNPSARSREYGEVMKLLQKHSEEWRKDRKKNKK